MSTDIPAEGSSLSPLCRAFGLAAVAAELNLQTDTLEPETARAIERGAAALFLAGYGPKLTRYAASARGNTRDERVTRPFTKAVRSERAYRKNRAGAIVAN